MNKCKFTKQFCTDAGLANGTYYGTEVKGLVLYVTSFSRKFGVYGWYNGTATRKTLGDIADWTIPAVREEAVRVRGGGEPANFCSPSTCPDQP